MTMDKTVARQAEGCAFLTGVVKAAMRNGNFRMRLDGADVTARKSAGCLLEPGKGDKALLIRSEEGGYYVVDVLERASESGALLRLPARSSIRAGDGSGELEIRAGELNLGGGVFKTVFKRVANVAGVVESKAELLRETVRRRYEDVEEVKDSRFGRLRCVVGGLLSLRGKVVEAKAEKRMKIDGESVDIG